MLFSHSSPTHTLYKASTQNGSELRAWRKKLQEFPQVQLHPNDLRLGLHEAGKEAQGCNETLRQKIFVLTGTCNSWVLIANFIQIIGKEIVGGGGGR